MFLFFSLVREGGGGEWGEGRDHLKCLRLQPGAGAGEKLFNEEGVIINFISAKPSNNTSPTTPQKNIRVPRTVKYQTKQSKWLKYIQCTITDYDLIEVIIMFLI